MTRSPATILRQAVCENGRSLHYRRLGEGSPVVLLHESPRSSVALLPLAERIAGEFTIFALDTPGYGLSDPLPLARPSIEDFADAVVRSLRAAGLTRVPVYGTHTGATIAAAMAARHPDFVTGVVLDGYPVFTRQERELHESFYLPAFPPRWDGSHIVSLWARVRDQYDYFPWYLRGETARLGPPKPRLARQRQVFHDFLRSGDSYAVAYAASFRFEPLDMLARIATPFHIVARDSDLLRGHLDRLPALPQGSSAGPIAADPDQWAAGIASLLRDLKGQEIPPPLHNAITSGSNGVRSVVDGRLFVTTFGQSTANPPLILVHDTPGSSDVLADDARRRATDRLVLVPDLPGHGRSPSLREDTAAAPQLAMLLGNTLAALGASTADIEGVGKGANFARALAAALPHALRYRQGDDALPNDEPLDQPLPPRFDGADLVAAWFRLRDRAVREADAGRDGELLAGADLGRLHAIFVADCLAEGHDDALVEAVTAKA